MRQADLDLAAARHAAAGEHFEWACFLVLDAARRLDKHYIGARYPNSHPAGAPGDLYTRSEAEQAFADASTVLEDVRRRLSSP